MLTQTNTRSQRRPDFVLTARARAELARIAADGAAYEERRAQARKDGEASTAAWLGRIRYFIATRIVRRWAAAGYTSARLVDGLPRPERPHVADWHGGRVFWTCGVCGCTAPASRTGATCQGRSGLDLVLQALEAGVAFGLGPDGLPTAGVPCEPGDVVEKLSRATCQPRVPRAERAPVPTMPDPAPCDVEEDCALCGAPTPLWTALPDRGPGEQVAICAGCARRTAPVDVPTKRAWLERTMPAGVWVTAAHVEARP